MIQARQYTQTANSCRLTPGRRDISWTAQCFSKRNRPGSCSRSMLLHRVTIDPNRSASSAGHWRCSAQPVVGELQQHAQLHWNGWQALAQHALGCLLCLVLAGGSLAAPAQAYETVGSFEASGLVFKDSVETLAIEDPAVKGVTIYISDFKRSITDRLAKNFFDDPSQVQDYKSIAGSSGQEVFSQAKGLNIFQNKTLRVRRIYDKQHNTLVYISYSTRLSNDSKTSSSRYRTSLCALPLAPSVQPATSDPSSSTPEQMALR